MRKQETGMFLIEVMIIVILVSVVATAYWNFRSSRIDPPAEYIEQSRGNDLIQEALDEISYHICFSREDTNSFSEENLIIEKGKKSDRITAYHNNVKYEYFVNEGGGLIRRVNDKSDVIALGIDALNVSKIGAQTIVVTILLDGNNIHGNSILTRSYSTVVATSGIR